MSDDFLNADDKRYATMPNEEMLRKMEEAFNAGMKHTVHPAEPIQSTQPPPVPSTGDCWQSVIDRMIQRRSFGITKYGRPVQPFNGRNSPLDLIEELLDAIVYCEQVSQEMESLRQQVWTLGKDNEELRGIIQSMNVDIVEEYRDRTI